MNTFDLGARARASARFAVIASMLAACGGAIPAAGAATFLSTPGGAASVRQEAGEWLLLRRNARWMNLAHSIACYDPDMTDEQLAHLEAQHGLVPAGHGDEWFPGRFVTSSVVWFGEGTTQASGQARGANLTYSFPADGVTWGLSGSGFGTAPNNLSAQIIAAITMGNGDPGRLDYGRELIRQAFAGWQFYSGLTYREVADDNVPQNQTVTRVATRGDIRIGAYNLGGQNGTLAYNAFPAPAPGIGITGGDMSLNSAYFTDSSFNGSSSTFRFLRNVVAHEHGHGTGMIHTVPCNNTKLMEPQIFTSRDMLQIDDIRGAQRNYGDRYQGNNSAGTAHDLGDMTDRGVVELFLSTNGASGPHNSNQDWFRFSLSEAQPVTITVTPQGGTYTAGQQSAGCSGSTGSINAASAGNLALELRDASGVTTLFSAASEPAGVAETITVPSLPAGEYTIRVIDNGPNLAGNQIVQMYDLLVRANNANTAPVALPGVNKRIAAGSMCFFFGDVNSRATQATAALFTSGYDWDLDGDGTFEVDANRRPNFIYPSNGDYVVTLRLTDSFGSTGYGSMVVTVYGATTSLDSVVPNLGEQGTDVPVTFTGVNLKNVVAGDFTVSGTGVSVIGTATPNALGTEVTGLSLSIAPDAAVSLRTITVANADGTDSIVGGFIVLPGSVVIDCPGDTDGNNVVNFLDLNTVLSQFGQAGAGLAGDVDGNGVVNFLDLNEILSNFGNVCE